ncbi:MAG: hypothetical protein H0T85_00945 [Geodermatophilaceae bacterium]|nr:hypothetical protein [Geodermatophilaceae bacterium]
MRRNGDRGRWRARYLDPDTSLTVSAPGTFATRVQADRWLAAKRADLDRGLVVDERAAGRPLSSWWPGYAAAIRGLRVNTQLSYETAWRLRVAPRFGRVLVRRIRPTQIEDWLAELTHQGVSASKVIEAHGVFKRVLDRAVRDGAIPLNPCAQRGLPLPRRPHLDRPVLAPEQVEALAAAMRHPEHATLVRLLAYGGLRIREASALRYGDLSRRAGTLRIAASVHEVAGHVEIGPTKDLPGADHRTARLGTSGAGADAPRRRRGRGGSDVPSQVGSPRHYGAFRRDVWDPAIRATGITATPHDLRATCASLLVDAVNPRVVGPACCLQRGTLRGGPDRQRGYRGIDYREPAGCARLRGDFLLDPRQLALSEVRSRCRGDLSEAWTAVEPSWRRRRRPWPSRALTVPHERSFTATPRGSACDSWFR